MAFTHAERRVVEYQPRVKADRRSELILDAREKVRDFIAKGGTIGSLAKVLYGNYFEVNTHRGRVEDIRSSSMFDEETQTPPGIISITVGGKRIRMRSLFDIRLVDEESRHL